MWELNRATLEVFNVQNNNAGRYTCSASNDAGQASCSADLFVKSKSVLKTLLFYVYYTTVFTIYPLDILPLIYFYI